MLLIVTPSVSGCNSRLRGSLWPLPGEPAMLGKWVGGQAAGARTAVAKKTQLGLLSEAGEPEASPAENGRELPPGQVQPPAPPPPPELEERVRRLEDILAGMQHSPTAIQEAPPQPPEAPA